MTQLTDWFPADVKPVHPGVYELERYGEPNRIFSRFDGVYWGSAAGFGDTAHSVRRAIAATDISGFAHLRGWRGLAEKPE